MRYVYLAVIVLFCGLVATFALQNLQSVTTSFVGLQLTAPLALLIAATYLLGMATGGGLFTFLRYTIHKASAGPRVQAADTARMIDHTP